MQGGDVGNVPKIQWLNATLSQNFSVYLISCGFIHMVKIYKKQTFLCLSCFLPSLPPPARLHHVTSGSSLPMPSRTTPSSSMCKCPCQYKGIVLPLSCFDLCLCVGQLICPCQSALNWLFNTAHVTWSESYISLNYRASLLFQMGVWVIHRSEKSVSPSEAAKSPLIIFLNEVYRLHCLIRVVKMWRMM